MMTILTVMIGVNSGRVLKVGVTNQIGLTHIC